MYFLIKSVWWIAKQIAWFALGYWIAKLILIGIGTLFGTKAMLWSSLVVFIVSILSLGYIAGSARK